MTCDILLTDEELRLASQSGSWDFLHTFILAYQNAIDNELTIENMNKLNGWQNVLMAFGVFRSEVRSGGFVQLIYNGYGPYIFENPFASALRKMGAQKLSKLIYKAKRIYDVRKKDLEMEVEEEELCEIYSNFEEFDPLDDLYIEIEQESIDIIAQYVDEHINYFASVLKGPSL
jgi:hypothetical protein